MDGIVVDIALSSAEAPPAYDKEKTDVVPTLPDTADTAGHGAGNTKKLPRSRAWCFTLNNFTPEDVTFFTDTLDTEKYMFQHEVGESGTPHLQGVVYFENARTFKQMKQLHTKAHWEITKCVKGSVNYCCDPSKRAVPQDIWCKGWTIPKPLRIISDLRPWQLEIAEIVKTEADDRTIHWYWETTGNVGKTALCKYLLSKYPHTHFFSGGKSNDIAFQIIKNKWVPDICVFDLPRSCEGKVSYNAMEQLKNGLVFSSKYEGGTKMFNPPHVIVFANWVPDTAQLSADRWRIVNINNGEGGSPT